MESSRMDSLAYLYVDRARGLVDVEYDPPPGAIGSGWQITTPEKAEEVMADLLREGWTRGHWTSPTF